MNTNTLKKFQALVGEVCSIITTAMNRQFDELVSRDHFCVRVHDVSVDGIWGTHPYNDDIVSFFAMPHIISVHREIELDPSNPEHAAMIKEMEKREGKKATQDLGATPLTKGARVGVSARGTGEGKQLPVLDKPPAPKAETSGAGDATFIDINSLEVLAEQTKQTFEAYDLRKKQQMLGAKPRA
jgi:hypothetical protein